MDKLLFRSCDFPALGMEESRTPYHRAACVSCNLCVRALGEGKPLACYLDTGDST